MIEIMVYLFSYKATSEGSIPMDEGEELYVIELDQGDGWNRVCCNLKIIINSPAQTHFTYNCQSFKVRRKTDATAWEEGFVPTSYIESALYA